ncbi:MAG: autotransporter domain-containing protein [Chthoniobacterales bacterium]
MNIITLSRYPVTRAICSVTLLFSLSSLVHPSFADPVVDSDNIATFIGSQTLTRPGSYAATYVGNSTLDETDGAASSSLLLKGSKALLKNEYELNVGQVGNNNTLIITNRASAQSGSIVVGDSSAANNGIALFGAGSTLTATDDIKVGGSKSTGNYLKALNGAVVTTGNISLGYDGGSSQNKATAQGKGSQINASETIIVGDAGSNNILTIEKGATGSSKATIIGKAMGATDNVMRVTGDGSHFETITLTVGQQGGGALTLDSGASLKADQIILAQNGKATFDPDSQGTINIGRKDHNDAAGTLDARVITFGAGASTINFNQTNEFQLTSQLATAPNGSTNVKVNQYGSGNTVFTQDNDYAGTTKIKKGTLEAQSKYAFGKSTLKLDGGNLIADTNLSVSSLKWQSTNSVVELNSSKDHLTVHDFSNNDKDATHYFDVSDLKTNSSKSHTLVKYAKGNGEGSYALAGVDPDSYKIANVANENGKGGKIVYQFSLFTPGVIEGFTPGVEEGVTPGVQKGFIPGVEKGVTPGVNPGETPGVNPGEVAGFTPGVKKKFIPGVEKGFTPGVNPGETPGVIPGEVAGFTPGVKKKFTPGVEKGFTPGVEKGFTPGINPGETPAVIPGEVAGFTPGVKKKFTPGVSKHFTPGVEKGFTPGVTPGVVPGFIPGVVEHFTPGVVDGYIPGEGKQILKNRNGLVADYKVKDAMLEKNSVLTVDRQATLTVDHDLVGNPTSEFIYEENSDHSGTGIDVGGTAYLNNAKVKIIFDKDPHYGDEIQILSASHVEGKFGEIDLGSSLLRARKICIGDPVEVIFIAPTVYTQMAVNKNQRNVAAALNSFIPAESGDPLVVSTALDELTPAEYQVAFQQIMPALYSSFSTIAFNNANAQNNQLIQRLGNIRVGGSGFDTSGMNEAPIQDDNKNPRKGEKDILIPSVDNHWGVFTDANGIFANANINNQLPGYSFESGGVTIGLDYKWNDHFSTGLYTGYEGTQSKQSGGNFICDNGSRFGAFGTYEQGGIFVNGLVGGDSHSYQVQRTIQFPGVKRTATSAPTAQELDTMLAGGYDMKRGKFVFGPMTSLQYTYLGVQPFTESGAQSLNLSVESQHANSLIYSLGPHAFYTCEMSKNILLIPQVNLAWQHEFLQNPYAINSTLQGGGGAFNYTTTAAPRDSLYTGIGFTVTMFKKYDASFFYNASAANPELVSQNFFASFGMKF